MGINGGPVHYIHDINNQINVSGDGVIQAQRVMDCGDGDHILVTTNVAEYVGTVPAWRRFFRYFGECTIKHGKTIALYSLVTGDVGSGALPRKMLEDAARAVDERRPCGHRIAVRHDSSPTGRRYLIAFLTGLAVGAAFFAIKAFYAGSVRATLSGSIAGAQPLGSVRALSPDSGRTPYSPSETGNPVVAFNTAKEPRSRRPARRPSGTGATVQPSLPDVPPEIEPAPEEIADDSQATTSQPRHWTLTLMVKPDGHRMRRLVVKLSGSGDPSKDQPL